MGLQALLHLLRVPSRILLRVPSRIPFTGALSYSFPYSWSKVLLGVNALDPQLTAANCKFAPQELALHVRQGRRVLAVVRARE